MTVKYVCPANNQEYSLPKNLLKHQRNKDGKWRYRGKDGLKCLTYYIDAANPDFIPVDIAIKAATQLNEKFSDAPKPVRKPLSSDLSMAYWVEQYILELYEIHEGEDFDNQTWENKRLMLRSFGRDFSHVAIHTVTLKSLKEWWWSRGAFEHKKPMSYHVHMKARNVIGGLFASLISDEVITLRNPFRAGTEVTFPVRKEKPKARGRLTLENFLAIREQASKCGDMFLVNAMDLGLQTKMRRTDLCNLTFEHWEDAYLFKDIEKDKDEKGQVNLWDLNDPLNSPIKAILDRAKATQNDVMVRTCTTPATHILHHAWDKYSMGDEKTHLSQVLPKQISVRFKKHRDAIGVCGDVPSIERPTFHEIRGLAGHIEQKTLKRDTETIAEGYAHSDVKTSIEKYLNDHEANIVKVTTAIPLEALEQHLTQKSQPNLH